jgi:NAD(P)-dependent dehydrogenase (short-subunit alcohol dehydrogenase family)
VIGLTKSAALDYAAHGVRINAVAPGPILTDRLKRVGAEAQRQAGLAMPMRRIGTPDEVAAAVV